MDLQFLASTPLFAGVKPADVEKMLSCLSPQRRRDLLDTLNLLAEHWTALDTDEDFLSCEEQCPSCQVKEDHL